MKKILAFSTAAALTTLSLQAGAASGPMPQGTFTVGAERLMGITHSSLKNDPYPGQPPDESGEWGVTTVTLLGNGVMYDPGANNGSGVDSRQMFLMPRIGLDYFIIDGLSLGGSLTFLSASVHDARNPNNDGSATMFLFQPRVGYAYMFGDVVGIWPRGGFAYTHGSVDPDLAPSWSNHYFALDIDVPLIIAPVKNFAFTVGPVFDITFGGSQSDPLPPPERSRDASLTMFGLTAGVLGIL
jgi:hypothetical protein